MILKTFLLTSAVKDGLMVYQEDGKEKSTFWANALNMLFRF
jgi:hypothetical protein